LSSETSSTLDDNNDNDDSLTGSTTTGGSRASAVASKSLTKDPQNAKKNNKNKRKKKNRRGVQVGFANKASSSSFSTAASGGGGGGAAAAAAAASALGKSLLLGAITFAAVLAAASSHESFFFDRFLLLGGSGGGGGDPKRQRSGGSSASAGAAAYIAPPHRHQGALPQSGTPSSAILDASADGTATLQVPTKRTKNKKNPFGRFIQKLVDRRQARKAGADDAKRGWFGSSWGANNNIKADRAKEELSTVPASSVTRSDDEGPAAFSLSMAADLTRRFPTAYTEASPPLTSEDVTRLQEYAELVRAHYGRVAKERGSKASEEWRKAAASPDVAWGGGDGGSGEAAWWDPAVAAKTAAKGGHAATDLDRLEGGHLLYSYYRIMKAIHDQSGKKKKSSETFDLTNVHFPLKKCHPPNGCSAAEGIDHTLQWRQSYQPWKVDAKVLRENAAGWMFVRGWGTTPDLSNKKVAEAATAKHGRHAILWARPGIHRAADGEAWIRTVLHGADRAVAQSLRASAGRVGKFNAVIDVTGFEWGRTLPALGTIQQVVSALQDHFPNRLGVVALLNLSRGAEIVVNLIKPWLTKDVRDKIHVVSLRDLPLLVEAESIPSWLGGPDTYEFNVDEYYPPRVRF
jgi:CRAL/TRIO domain